MNNSNKEFNPINDSNSPFSPTKDQWKAWYAHKSTKDLEIESEERAEVEEDK